ncbi:hypothetical protein BV25DRAFT_1919485 [Artomyces pyxidatus]|uniref:Uncharacterized protein n=1 Tax=Artomyces pyxidatus TaxID=48021 RepID=A0ACB8SQC4_9AGAM|nr:hypothetical protein BV25DRAFT_1919485 [Artomyces pyxidatus]
MGRTRGGPRGPKGWAKGDKYEFLMRRRPEYEQAREIGTDTVMGRFYDKVSRVFDVKYGREDPPETAVLDNIPDPDEEAIAAAAEADKLLTPEEAKKKDQFLKELKKRIGAWYRYHCAKVNKGTKENTWVRQLFRAAVEPPKKMQATHMYSKMYYETRIKPKFDVEWAELKAKKKAEGKTATKGQWIGLLGVVTRREWTFEVAEFRKEVERRVDEEYKRACEEYHDKYVRDLETPEEFHLALNSAYMTLQPIVDLIAKRYGMVVNLTMARPTPSKKGAIEAFIIQSGKTNGLHEMSWTEFDPQAQADFSKAYIAFAENAFSKETRESRARSSTPVAEGSEAEDDEDSLDYNFTTQGPQPPSDLPSRSQSPALGPEPLRVPTPAAIQEALSPIQGPESDRTELRGDELDLQHFAIDPQLLLQDPALRQYPELSQPNILQQPSVRQQQLASPPSFLTQQPLGLQQSEFQQLALQSIALHGVGIQPVQQPASQQPVQPVIPEQPALPQPMLEALGLEVPNLQAPAPEQLASQPPALQAPALQAPVLELPAHQPRTLQVEPLEPQPPTFQPPALQHPALEQPAVQVPAVQVPALEQPALQLPAMPVPAVQHPALEQPAVQVPAVQQPALPQPALQLPAMPVPAVQHPALEQPAVQVPAVQQPALQLPAMPVPAVQHPALEQPAVQVPAVQQPALQLPAMPVPAVQHPALEQPAVQVPAVQQPALPQPALLQPMLQQHAVQVSTVQPPALQPPAVEVRARQVPVPPQPTLQPPAVPVPAIQQHTLQQPGFQQPALQRAALQVPAVQQHALQQPAVPVPAVQQPAVQVSTLQIPAVQQSPLATQERTNPGSPASSDSGSSSPAPSLSTSPALRTPAEARAMFASMTLAIVSNGADCHKAVYENLAPLPLGDGWDQCLAAYFEFEMKHGFQKDGPRLGTPASRTTRPTAIAQWIKCGRREWVDVNVDLATVGLEFWSWLRSLVPPAQVTADGRLLRDAGGTWDDLAKPGVNGILSVVALLAWWGMALTREIATVPQAHHRDYDRAVADVTWSGAEEIQDEKEAELSILNYTHIPIYPVNIDVTCLAVQLAPTPSPLSHLFLAAGHPPFVTFVSVHVLAILSLAFALARVCDQMIIIFYSYPSDLQEILYMSTRHKQRGTHRPTACVATMARGATAKNSAARIPGTCKRRGHRYTWQQRRREGTGAGGGGGGGRESQWVASTGMKECT